MMHLDFGGEDMFVIVTYDVHKRRCHKVMKYLRLWLEHRQRSVFSGYLSTSQVRSMELGLRKVIDPTYDSVIIFQTNRADQITETCTRVAHEARITSMVVMPQEQRRKIASMKARHTRTASGKMASHIDADRPASVPHAGRNKKRNRNDWRFRF
jgi:CRISPR-associated protein Cas2